MEIGVVSNKKIKGSEEDEIDRLSKLPDSILLHILSLLPIKDAVNTMLLRVFGRLWTNLQTLEFDGRTYEQYKGVSYQKSFFTFVNNVLRHHDCPSIFKFSLKFGSYLYFLPSDVSPCRPRKHLHTVLADEVNLWIAFAVSKKVKVLDLGILAHGSSSTRFEYGLPGTILACDSLTELNLVNIALCQEFAVQMRSLKTLSLTTIVLSDAIVENFMVGCPLLESLSIIQCSGIRKVNCTSENLKHLMFVLGAYEAEPVEILGPHLSSLHIAGNGINGHIVLKDIPSLVEASLDLCFVGGFPIDRFGNVGVLLEKVHHANTFKISNWSILKKGVTCPHSPRQSVTLKTPLSKWHLLGIANLVKRSRNLETLTLDIESDASLTNTGDDLRLGISKPFEGNYLCKKKLWLDSDEEHNLYSKPTIRGALTHLKTVKLSGYMSNPHVIPLVRFLLGNASALQNIVIDIGKYKERFLLEFSTKIMGFPRASSSVAVMFS